MLLVKLIEPPCTERYARWCERSVGEIIAYLLLDCYPLTKYFEMSELCNNSACFSVEIKGTSDICVAFVVYACGKSILGGEDT